MTLLFWAIQLFVVGVVAAAGVTDRPLADAARQFGERQEQR